jgi:LysM repeat protein
MSWFGQKNYNDKLGSGPYTIAQVGCFLTAFCNLLQKYGVTVTPPDMNRLFNQRNIFLADPSDGGKDELGWNSITAYDGQVHATNISNNAGGTWPSSSNAIVKFAYKSPKTGADTTHFCLVADPQAHTIVDSWDGVIRTPGYYGEPVAWAEYANVAPEVVVVSQQQASYVKPSAATTGDTVALQKGDTIAAIALRYGFTAQDLLDHNGLSWGDARNLPVGYIIRLPIANAPAPVNTGYKIELLPEPKQMHVSKVGGTEKWAFGSIKTWSDFVSTGHVPENTNLTISAVASVIVAGSAVAYYMEPINVGNFATTGQPANTIGYNWSDLADGHVDAPAAPAPTPEPTPPAPEAAATHALPAPAVEASTKDPNAYKATYKAFPKPVIFLANNTIMCKEYDGRRSDHQLIKNEGVSIAGTFIHGQTLYGRPTGVVKAGYWFGVPMDELTSEDELYNIKVDLPTKVAMHAALSFNERILAILASILAKFESVKNKK